MIKKIKSSLFAKVFLLTATFLLCVSFLVYGLLAWMMPNTYSTALNDATDKMVRSFLTEVEQVTLENSGQLFDQFIQNANIRKIELYDANGVQVSPPTGSSNENMPSEGTACSWSGGDSVPILSNSYYFSFAHSNTRYMLIVYTEATQVAELQKAFQQVFPLLCLASLMISLLASLAYARIITKPVLRISGVSKEMSDLQLKWQLKENRSDELGVLEKSLNSLSRNLSAALSDLQSANEKLAADIAYEKKIEQAQLDFFSAVSHELKTPITVIKGQLEGMLLGVGAYKDHEKYLTRSLEVVNTLETMVQEILTVSRLEISKADFKTEPFDCVPIVRGYLAKTEDLIVQKELQLHCDMPQTVLIKGDKALLEKVFSNLIGNTVKYAPQGASVTIAISEKQGGYTFSVENTGTHIPENCFSKLFDAFYRIDQSRSRKTGGSGLGLYIVQKILEQHRSRCFVCNTPSGIRFSFTLAR